MNKFKKFLLDNLYIFIHVAIILFIILMIAAGLAISLRIANSDLPFWVKYVLLHK